MNRPRMFREMIGRSVRLVRDLKSAGGETFGRGSVLIVSGHYRGTLSLKKQNQNRPASGVANLRGVALDDVEFVETE